VRRHHLALVGATACLINGVAAAAVGRIESSYGVTADGQPVHTIPIRATDGVRGLTPQLAIAYVGPDSRSTLGVGMALTGLSSVRPCPQTIAQDGTAGPVRLAAGDRYCLNGARLRHVSGTYGADGSVYRTEIDQLARITAYASTGGVPGWFNVETSDGLIQEYGHTPDSLLSTRTTNGATQAWALNAIRDRSGNSITFSYDNDDDAHRQRPSLIQYTHNSHGAGHYDIRFVYQSSDRSDTYTSGVSSSGDPALLRETRLLERLELRHDGAVYRQYVFAYQTGAGENSRLSSVQECAADLGTCFPATTFTWTDATAGFGSATNLGASVAAAIPFDFNGDGR
jgi:hypothetical protein